MEYRRVMIMRRGYADVPAMPDQEALEKAKELLESDFDWEPVNTGFLNTAEVEDSMNRSV